MFDKNTCTSLLVELDRVKDETVGAKELNQRAALALRHCLTHIDELEATIVTLQTKIGVAAEDAIKARDA